MKEVDIPNEFLLRRMTEYLMGMIEMDENDDKKVWMKRIKASLCLKGLCENNGSISFFFSLFFIFSLFLCFFLNFLSFDLHFVSFVR
jgi:hypothetical protein